MDKKQEGKQVSMNGQGQPAQSAQNGAAAPPTPVYKFTPEAYNTLGQYLMTRPIGQVQGIYKAFFRHGQKDPFYKQEAISRLVEYLMSCPLGEVEPILEMLQNGGMQEYLPQAEGAPAPGAEGDKPKEAPSEAPKE